jgi:hypothetical protein
MDTASRSQSLIGKRGTCKLAGGSKEVGFTILSVELPPRLLSETDDNAEDLVALDGGRFRVRFDDESLIDGSSTGVISGYEISSSKEE